MKLSDTQLLILSSASQRTDPAVVLPANLKGSAAKKVVDRLLNEKLLQELRAKDDMPVWRRGDDNRRYSLRIIKAGRRAIEVEVAKRGQLHNASPTRDSPFNVVANSSTNSAILRDCALLTGWIAKKVAGSGSNGSSTVTSRPAVM